MKRHSGERRAQALIALASRSVGSKQATHAYKLHLKQLLDEYDLACQQLETVEAGDHAVIRTIPFAKSMLAIKGISAISLAGILGEAGDLKRLCSRQCFAASCWPQSRRSKLRQMDGADED